MNQNQLPFEYISVQDVVSMLQQHGHVLSLMDTCGFFLCQNGWVEVSINELVNPPDLFFSSSTINLTFSSASFVVLTFNNSGCSFGFIGYQLRAAFARTLAGRSQHRSDTRTTLHHAHS